MPLAWFVLCAVSITRMSTEVFLNDMEMHLMYSPTPALGGGRKSIYIYIYIHNSPLKGIRVRNFYMIFIGDLYAMPVFVNPFLILF